MKPIDPHNRDGFALPAALLALIVIGAIVTGGFFVAGQEHEVSVSTDLGARAMIVAEYGLQDQLATLTTNHVRNLVLGQATPFGSVALADAGRDMGTYNIRVLPVTGDLFFIESEGRVERGRNTATRRVGVLARSGSMALPFQGAITALGAFNRQGAARISGTDRCDPTSVLPGVTAMDEDSVTGLIHGQVEAISGNPPVLGFEGLNQDTLASFGGVTLDQIKASATLRYDGPANPTVMRPVTTTDAMGNTMCNPMPNQVLGGSGDNWGEPYPAGQSGYVAACADHYPIIYSDGDLNLTTGRGQGILVVDGDLDVSGNFEFDGIVIVTGKFTMSGTGGQQGGAKINGTVIAFGEGVLNYGDEHSTTGNALVQWDSCAVNDAMGSLRLRPLPQRAWVSDTPRLPGT